MFSLTMGLEPVNGLIRNVSAKQCDVTIVNHRGMLPSNMMMLSVMTTKEHITNESIANSPVPAGGPGAEHQ